MSTGAELTTLVRDQVGFAAPVSGGDDFLNDTNILRWINNALDRMSKSVFGIPVYVEFTVQTNGDLAVTKSTSTPVVGAGDLVEVVEDYTYIQVPGLQAYSSFMNLSAAVKNTTTAPMQTYDIRDYRFQETWRGSTDYYWAVAMAGEKGFVLLPEIITVENTIGLEYRQEFVDITSGTSPPSYFAEDDQQAAADAATAKACRQLEFYAKAREYDSEAARGMAQFYAEKRDRNAAAAPNVWNPWGNQFVRRTRGAS